MTGRQDPDGSRPLLGASLLRYYDPAGTLTYAGRVGTGITAAELERLRHRLQPLAADAIPFDLPQRSRCGTASQRAVITDNKTAISKTGGRDEFNYAVHPS